MLEACDPSGEKLPALQTRIDRKRFLGIGGSFIAVALLPRLSRLHLSQDSITMESPFAVRSGSYFPTGEGLEAPLKKFALAHRLLTRENGNAENVNSNIDRFLGRFTGRFAVDRATGICNGFSNYQAHAYTTQELSLTGRTFSLTLSQDEIDAVGSVIHYDDAPYVETFEGKTFTLREKSSPVFLHYMIWENLGQKGIPLVINRSTIEDQVWTHPVDQAVMNIQPLGDNWVYVHLTMRAGNYWEEPDQGLPYRYIETRYVVHDGDVYHPGEYVDGGLPIRSLWRPDIKRFWAGYRIKGNIMTPSMIETFSRLTVPQVI